MFACLDWHHLQRCAFSPCMHTHIQLLSHAVLCWPAAVSLLLPLIINLQHARLSAVCVPDCVGAGMRTSRTLLGLLILCGLLQALFSLQQAFVVWFLRVWWGRAGTVSPGSSLECGSRVSLHRGTTECICPLGPQLLALIRVGSSLDWTLTAQRAAAAAAATCRRPQCC